jgi:hypothetical protein
MGKSNHGTNANRGMRQQASRSENMVRFDANSGYLPLICQGTGMLEVRIRLCRVQDRMVNQSGNL